MTPEEAAALRARLVGTSAVTPLDRKLADVGNSASRLLNHPANPLTMGSGPTGAVYGLAAEELAMGQRGQLAGLSQAAQAQMADRVSAPMVMRPMDTPAAAVEASPSLASMAAPAPARPGGGGGGAPGGGLGGLREAFMAARRRQLGDFETDKELAGQMGVDKSVRTMAVADLERAQAARVQRDAELQQQADAEASEKHQAFLARNEKLADDIGRQRIDPKKLAGNTTIGEDIVDIIGSIAGGAIAGAKGGPNQYMQLLERNLDRMIAAEEKNIDNKKASLAARNSLFGQMLQETGDRRLAAMQTRNLVYEAAKQKIAADAAELGVPEIQTGAQQQVAEIQHKQDALNSQLSGEAYQQAVQQANAAASAQRAAEENAWKRQMQVMEMGFKRDELDLKRAQALGGSPEDLQKQAAQLGDKLGDEKLAKGRAAIDNLKARLAKAPEGEGLPGVGRWGDFKVAVLGQRLGLSNEERLARGDWDKLKLAYQSQITGSGASEAEREMISKAFEGAKTPAEQRQAVAEADAVFKQVEMRHKAGFDPRAVQLYEQRLGNIASGNVSDERAKTLKKKLGGY